MLRRYDAKPSSLGGLAMQSKHGDDLWNGERGAGGISWVDRARMGPFRGVMDAADADGRKNEYMHVLHKMVVERELRRLVSSARALDFGCGTGRFLATLSAYFREVYALDTEPQMLLAARTYAANCVKGFVCWDKARTTFESGYFDFVLCSSVLGVTAAHLFERSVNEMGRVCKHGGTLLLLEQVSDKRGLTLDRYRSALRNAGFRILQAHPIRSAVSPFTSFVMQHRWLPPRFFMALARIETALTARRLFASGEPYVEYVIVARRR